MTLSEEVEQLAKQLAELRKQLQGVTASFATLSSRIAGQEKR